MYIYIHTYIFIYLFVYICSALISGGAHEVVVDTDGEGRAREREEERDGPVELCAGDAVEQSVGEGVVDQPGVERDETRLERREAWVEPSLPFVG